MKLSTILTAFLLVVFLRVNAIVAQSTRANDKAAAEKTEQATLSKGQAQETKADANSIADVNAPAEDPNAVEAKNKELEELEIAFKKLDKSGEKEIREWMRRVIHNRANLVEATYRQTAEELNFIRKFAVEQGASKTVSAIDFLLAKRNERLKEITTKLKEQEERQEARQERESKKSKGTGDRRRDRDSRRRSRQ